jgi:hypothetical protein
MPKIKVVLGDNHRLLPGLPGGFGDFRTLQHLGANIAEYLNQCG